ncbi:RcpC/CpaB family pilus assembly protein [Pseudarthrobacter enclensis]|uniref:Flp pilus assembly protein CpaB n=1 Tax=Pseudarthrobacter enclensis TaxID=993070 RepID=A0ABT9RS50_9MICC|nr:RcpC/CpaB family pilus assembly protein [Pseudarthrobacter enclensis]MDP9888066.1 Flp pilus assembly protein CpaB [Pseudarthrobacter enclensis]
MPRLPRRRRDGFRLSTPPHSLQARSKSRPVRVRLGAWLNRNRRLAAALLFCAAAAVAVQQLTPAPLSTVPALAAARDLPAGSAVTAADLARVQVPPGMVADGVLQDGAAAAGKQLAAPVRKGQLLTDTQFLGPGLLAGTPPGSAAVPLRMADAASIQLVSPGQLVNVVLTSANGFDQQGPSEVLASAVPVLWTSNNGGQGGQWLGTGETDGLIVVAATTEQSSRLAGASTQGRLFFVLVSPQ